MRRIFKFIFWLILLVEVFVRHSMFEGAVTAVGLSAVIAEVLAERNSSITFTYLHFSLMTTAMFILCSGELLPLSICLVAICIVHFELVSLWAFVNERTLCFFFFSQQLKAQGQNVGKLCFQEEMVSWLGLFDNVTF